jgi:hypothetical protein
LFLATIVWTLIVAWGHSRVWQSGMSEYGRVIREYGKVEGEGTLFERRYSSNQSIIEHMNLVYLNVLYIDRFK